VPVKHANTEKVAKGLTEKMICYFGPPVVLLTDQGTHFQNKLLEEFAKLFDINKYCTTAYHPQSNGSIERMHYTLTEYLRKYVENKIEWNT
jgi:transposase InsO family protein